MGERCTTPECGHPMPEHEYLGFVGPCGAAPDGCGAFQAADREEGTK